MRFEAGDDFQAPGGYVKVMFRTGPRHLTCVLLPLLLLLGGTPAGAWHCADGNPCEVSTVLACCCGGPEGAPTGPRHGAPIPATSAEECGCYYHSGELPAAAHSVGFHASLPPAAFTLAFPTREWSAPLPNPNEGGPPGHLISPWNTRGPPSA